MKKPEIHINIRGDYIKSPLWVLILTLCLLIILGGCGNKCSDVEPYVYYNNKNYYLALKPEYITDSLENYKGAFLGDFFLIRSKKTPCRRPEKIPCRLYEFTLAGGTELILAEYEGKYELYKFSQFVFVDNEDSIKFSEILDIYDVKSGKDIERIIIYGGDIYTDGNETVLSTITVAEEIAAIFECLDRDNLVKSSIYPIHVDDYNKSKESIALKIETFYNSYFMIYLHEYDGKGYMTSAGAYFELPPELEEIGRLYW